MTEMQREGPPEDKITKSRVRKLLNAVHPDKLMRAGMSENDAKIGEPLVILLDRMLKNQEDTENWGSDINKQYPAGSQIVLVGVSRDGVLRPPQLISMRKPLDFLNILEEYIAIGDISEDLPTPYNPLTAPLSAGVVPDTDDGDEDTDDPDSPWAQGNAQSESDEATDSLKISIQNAADFDQCTGLRLATRLYAQHTMRMYGVLQLLDEKVEKMILKEIEDADTQEKLIAAESHIKEFDFDDAGAAPRLLHKLEEVKAPSHEQSKPVQKTLEAFEQQGARAKSIDDVLALARDIRTTEFETDDERVATTRRLNTFAKNVLFKQMRSVQTLSGLAAIKNAAIRFPFSDEHYGLDVVDSIDTFAKYLMLRLIHAAKKEPELDALSNEITQFGFGNTEHVEYLKTQLDTARRLLHKKRDPSS